MRYLSVSTKINLAVLAISLFSIILGFFMLFWYEHRIENNVYADTKTTLIETTSNAIASKKSIGLTNAISIANDERISKSLQTNDRMLAIASLKDISMKMKLYTSFKNIKIHIHTKNNHSFLRNWKLDKYGDDLSSFRATVVHVNRTQAPVTSFEPGRAGLLLRAVIPIFNTKKEHLGSLEFIQGVNSIVKSLEKNSHYFLLLMDEKVEKNIQKGKDFSFEKNIKFQDYILSQKYFNKAFAKRIDIDKLKEKGYILSANYFYTMMPIKDFQGKNLGFALLGEPLSHVQGTLDGAKNLIYIALLGILFLILVISLVVLRAVKNLVQQPLQQFENALMSFFSFLRGEKHEVQDIVIDTNDEFGVMSRSLQENIAYSVELHEEIYALNHHLEERVDEKTKKIKTLLDNAGQGFLSFSCDMIVDKEHSQECVKLLGEEISGKSIVDLLFQESAKKKFFQKTIFETCSIENLTVQKTILSLLPHEIILHRRALKLEYKIIENKKLMMMITNVTAQKKLQKKVKREQEILKMIVEIISQNDSFYDAKRSYELFMEHVDDFVDMKRTSLNNIGEIYRTIHTFKGTFSQLYMQNIVRFLHTLESKISLMIQDETHTNETLLHLLKFSNCKENFEKEMQVIRTILGDEFIDSDNIIAIPHEDIDILHQKINTVFQAENLKSIESKEIVNLIANMSQQKLMKMLKPYIGFVQKLSLELHKELYELKLIGDNEILLNDRYKPFIKSLVHVFKNCVDHGIEDAETRLRNDKDEVGTITCSFSQDKETLQLIISDDGQGIDSEAIGKKALDLGLLTGEKLNSLSENEIYQFIFEENFSTKEEVSEISGRGVGMNAVKMEIEKLGGYIEISSRKNIGTTFIMNLPSCSG